MNGIGWAVKQLRDGKRVQREGWNGKGMWLAYVSKGWDAEIVGGDLLEDWLGNLPFVAMFTADKYLVPWLCSQTDLLATDWQLAG
jgi:hypothetical protein